MKTTTTQAKNMNPNSKLGTLLSPTEVRLVRTLPGPIERVWEYLTDPKKRARWLAAGEMEPKAGGKVTFLFRHRDLCPGETPPPEYASHHNDGNQMTGTVLRWEPPRFLSFTFGSDAESMVTIELTEQGKNVVLVLTHRATAGDIPYLSSFSAGWHTHLALFETVLNGTSLSSFWPMFVELKTEYEAALAGVRSH
jgi:uncharacterized protein YndB with AHSA1/START domain